MILFCKPATLYLFTNFSPVASFNCTFDDGFCNWKSVSNTKLNLKWGRQQTSTSNTGPDSDHTSGGNDTTLFMHIRFIILLHLIKKHKDNLNSMIFYSYITYCKST